MRFADTKLISTAPGTIASATSASFQFKANSTAIAISRRTADNDGDTIAICSSPVVVSMSPVSRGILSRLTGDIDTTTGLLQMAIVSPSLSAVRLLIAMAVLFALNWKLALVALAIVPGAVLMSFVSAKRIRPIYRAIRKDVEHVDGRVGETFSGIRVVRAFRRELLETYEYLRGRHTIVRKELFAHRRELWLWTSWGFAMSAVSVAIVWYGGH